MNMVYSEVVAAGLILAKKDKYTMRDVYTAMGASLFKPYKGRTITLDEAKFVAKASAVFHGTEHAETLDH